MRASVNKKKIIVLDDDTTILEVTKDALENEGYDVTIISNSLNLTEYLTKTEYDLLITDIYMPFKEGIEIIQEVPKISPGTKIIAMSGGMGYGDILTIAKGLGSDRVLYKPFKVEELIETTESVFN